MHSKSKNISPSHVFSLVFIIFIGLLGFLSLFLHCETDIYDYSGAKAIAHHRFYIYGCLSALAVGAIVLLCALLERIFSNTKKAEKISRGIFFFCGAVILAAGIAWVLFNDCAPINDQRDVYKEALRIAGVVNEPFDTDYFSIFHRNRGTVLWMAAAIKVFGPSLYSFRILNLMAILVIYYNVCQTAKAVFRNPVVTAVTSFLLMLFYPIVIYTSFLYGTLLSIAFTSLGIYATVLLCETNRLRYGVLLIFAFPLGIAMHQSAAIGLVASVIYLIMNSQKRTLSRNILICVFAVIAVFGSTKITDTVYTQITGTDPNVDAIPATCTIYMGLSASAGNAGPGSQDRSYAEIYMEYGRNAQDASREAVRRIAEVVREYLNGTRSLTFFLEKTEYQWLDPTFGARKIIHPNDPTMGDPPNSDMFMKFYNSPLRSIIFKLSISFMLLIYVGSFIAGVKTIRNVKAYPATVLILLYVIGGGAFQTLWESLSRYCLGYFIWLIPTAAFGLYSLYLRR